MIIVVLALLFFCVLAHMVLLEDIPREYRFGYIMYYIYALILMMCLGMMIK